MITPTLNLLLYRLEHLVGTMSDAGERLEFMRQDLESGATRRPHWIEHMKGFLAGLKCGGIIAYEDECDLCELLSRALEEGEA